MIWDFYDFLKGFKALETFVSRFRPPPIPREPWNCYSVSEISYSVTGLLDLANLSAVSWPVFIWSPPGYTSVICKPFKVLLSLYPPALLTGQLSIPIRPVLYWVRTSVLLYSTSAYSRPSRQLDRGCTQGPGDIPSLLLHSHINFTVLFQLCSSPSPSAIPSERSSLENAQTGKGCSGFLPLREHPYPRLLSLMVERMFPPHLLLVLVLTANPPINSLHSPGLPIF